MEFLDYQWSGQRWESVEIEPINAAYFFPMLDYLMATYGFPMPRVIDTIDGYAADFRLMGSDATLQIDAYSFSIAVQDKVVRDVVLAALRALPEGYFEVGNA